ncbi:MAG: FCD domain-containing protein, partial [Mesorhizobium sp.]
WLRSVSGFSTFFAASHVAFLAADRAFRLALAELSGNLRLAHLLDQILDQSARVLHLGFKSRDFTQLIIAQQRELVLACEAGDVSGIVKLARSQCLYLKKQVLEALLAGSKLQDVNLQPFA